MAAVAVLGLRRTRTAGLLLLVLGVAPFLFAGSGHLARGSLTVVAAPAVVAGLLYLASAGMDRHGGRTGAIGYRPPGGFDGAARQSRHVGSR